MKVRHVCAIVLFALGMIIPGAFGIDSLPGAISIIAGSIGLLVGSWEIRPAPVLGLVVLVAGLMFTLVGIPAATSGSEFLGPQGAMMASAGIQWMAFGFVHTLAGWNKLKELIEEYSGPTNGNSPS